MRCLMAGRRASYRLGGCLVFISRIFARPVMDLHEPPPLIGLTLIRSPRPNPSFPPSLWIPPISLPFSEYLPRIVTNLSLATYHGQLLYRFPPPYTPLVFLFFSRLSLSVDVHTPSLVRTNNGFPSHSLVQTNLYVYKKASSIHSGFYRLGLSPGISSSCFVARSFFFIPSVIYVSFIQ